MDLEDCTQFLHPHTFSSPREKGCTCSGRSSGFGIALLLRPSRKPSGFQWHVLSFVPHHSGGTAWVLHPFPSSSTSNRHEHPNRICQRRTIDGCRKKSKTAYRRRANALIYNAPAGGSIDSTRSITGTTTWLPRTDGSRHPSPPSQFSSLGPLERPRGEESWTPLFKHTSPPHKNRQTHD